MFTLHNSNVNKNRIKVYSYVKANIIYHFERRNTVIAFTL